MAKHRKRGRRNSGFVAIPIDTDLALGTLANNAVLLINLLGANFTEDFYAISVEMNAQIIALTAGQGDPTMAGYAHGDYTTTEITDALQVVLLGPGDKISQERSRRLVRKAGIFMGGPAGVQTTMKLFGPTGEGLVKTKLRFVCNSGKSLSFWVQNRSGSNLSTGGTLRLQGTLYGRWIL